MCQLSSKMLMKMFRYMSSNCSYSNLVFPSYVKEELFYDLCKFGFNTVVSSHSAHSFFSIISDLNTVVGTAANFMACWV